MTNLKCHFDADGWLQGPIIIGHLMTPNYYSTGFGTGRGVVMHTEDGYETGTVATFMNSKSQVSAFFSVAQDGSCHQYLPVGRGYCAWSQADGNQAWRGIEDEDRTDPSIPLTAAQMTAFAQILEACSAYDGFPLQVTDSTSGQGLILHSDGGTAWGGHFSCPGNVRAAQRPQIVALAKAIRVGGSVTPPAPKPATAPPFPWPAGDYIGVESADPHCHSGYYAADRPHIQAWQQQMERRGWGITVSGLYGSGSQSVARAFQSEHGLTADGEVGSVTWTASFTDPVT